MTKLYFQLFFIISLSFTLSLFNPDVVLAQEDDFEEYDEFEDEEELEDEEEEDDFENDVEEFGFETHLVKFSFTSRISFQEQPNEENAYSDYPYLEIEYLTEWEIPIDITSKKQSQDIEAYYSNQNWGSLAKNEFFDCRLEIEMDQLPVSLTTSFKRAKNEEESNKFVVRTKFDKNLDEGWFSYCTDISGAQLNTQGERENYLYQVIKRIEPNLKKIEIEEFDQTEYYEIDLNVEPVIIEDNEIANDVILSGNGSLIIEPL